MNALTCWKRVSNVRKILSIGFLLVVLAVSTYAGPRKGQTIPDQKRTIQIQSALIDHGFLFGLPSGKWDNQTVEILKGIAKDHHWQTRHVPDARVLIILGLSKGNPEVLDKPNHLDYNKGTPEVVPEDEQ
jgi:hypothetical protein